MTEPWQQLADEYDAGRIGYSKELYETIAGFGLQRGATVLDVGCGTGLAGEPFAANGFPVTGLDLSQAMLAKAKERLPNATLFVGTAEELPFPDERFDIAISAQAFHWFDRAKAIAQIFRVLRPGGIVAIWWKHLMAQDIVKTIRDEVCRSLGKEPFTSGLQGGFKEFYASAFAQKTLRVIPWRVSMRLDRFMGMERSRCGARQTLGPQADAYYSELEQRLRARFGEENPMFVLAYTQYLYLAKKP